VGGREKWGSSVLAVKSSDERRGEAKRQKPFGFTTITERGVKKSTKGQARQEQPAFEVITSA